MGNFSISHYAAIRVEPGYIELQYLIDMAEIPTFQELQQAGISAKADDPRVQVYLVGRAESLKEGLHLTINGETLPLEVVGQEILFPQGAGGLPTMKLGITYRASLIEACEASGCELRYHDVNFPGRAGWKEIVLTQGEGVAIESSSASSHDRSAQLSNYPTDLVNSAPQELDAKIVFSSTIVSPSAGSLPTTKRQISTAAIVLDARQTVRQTPKQDKAPSSASAAATSSQVKLTPNQQSTPRSSFTELIGTKEIGLGIALLAALISAGLGALHALEPGHGKTIVAAYLVGSRGTAKHALLLGMIVTAAHTAGVYLLAAITIYAQKYILPERIYPLLGVLSGVLIAGMGCYLLLQRYLGAEFSHRHDYSAAIESESVNNSRTPQSRKVSAKQLVLLGVTGGIIPCPAALVVLLSAVALHRTVFGLYLIVAFSFGLAAVLIGMGMVTVYAGRLMSRLHLEGPFLQKWLPMGSAAVITFLGCGIALRSLTTAGLLHIHILG